MSYVNFSSILGVGITFTVTSLASVTVRFAVRLQQRMAIGADDWLALAAMVFVVAAACICIAGPPTRTIGSHSPPDIGFGIFTYINAEQQELKRLEFAFYCLLIPGLTFLKLSVLFFYRRIFKINRIFKICFWVLTIFSILWGLSFFIAWTAVCPSFEDRITSLQTLALNCGNTFNLLVTQAVFDVVVDLAILVLPIPFVVTLQLSIRKKLAVLGVLLVGSLAIACGMARMIIVGMILGTPLLSRPSVAGISTADFNGIVSLLMFWGMLELGVGMIAICLPVMRPAISGQHITGILISLRSFASLRGSTRGSRDNSHATQQSAEESDSVEKGVAIKKQTEYYVTSSSGGPAIQHGKPPV